MNISHYTCRVTWSAEDNAHVGLCAELPSLPWLAPTPEKALSGIRRVVADAVADMKASGEQIPEALAEKKFSGRFMVRIPSSVHRALATDAAEQGFSINRLVAAKLTVWVMSMRHPAICSQGSSLLETALSVAPKRALEPGVKPSSAASMVMCFR